jgi:hypothetical protein
MVCQEACYTDVRERLVLSPSSIVVWSSCPYFAGIRLVQEARKENSELSMNAAVVWTGWRVGVNADPLRCRCKQADIDARDAFRYNCP